MLLSVKNISKAFDAVPVLHQVNFELHSNETLSILGKSGCGKTTMLKIIAGLVQQDMGDIFLNDLNINHKKTHQRNIVYMSQEPLLFPHLSVFENIAFGLNIQKKKKEFINEKVNELIEQLGLQEHKKKMPHQLSGGQKQRVNFGRAIIINPPLLLLDEPFGNLDAQTRNEMQLLFKKISNEYAISSVFVTHDVKEAILMADKMGFMSAGNLKVYTDKNAFVEDESTGAKAEINFWKSI